MKLIEFSELFCAHFEISAENEKLIRRYLITNGLLPKSSPAKHIDADENIAFVWILALACWGFCSRITEISPLVKSFGSIRYKGNTLFSVGAQMVKNSHLIADPYEGKDSIAMELIMPSLGAKVHDRYGDAQIFGNCDWNPINARVLVRSSAFLDTARMAGIECVTGLTDRVHGPCKHGPAP